jgi:hypothetical protein
MATHFFQTNKQRDWFESVMKKVQTGLDAGARPQAGDNPPGVAPTVDQMNKFKNKYKN